MVKAKISDVIVNRLPEWVQTKETFTKFIQYYYEWMEMDGNPTSFLRDIVEKSDIDETDDSLVNLILGKVTEFIPNDAITDHKLLTKNIRTFLRSKGTDESLNFIMKAVFGEEAWRQNMSKFVARTSSNEYVQDGFISVEVDSLDINFSESIGSTLVQEYTPASCKIENAEFHATPDGRMFWVITFDPKNLNGLFELGRNVRAIKSLVDVTFTEVTDYQTVSFLDVVGKTISFKSDKAIEFFEGELILGLDSNFRGVYESTNQYYIQNDFHFYDVKLSEYTGTISAEDECYLISDIIENTHITKNDYSYGVVSESISKFDYINHGSGYVDGMQIAITDGSGLGATAYIGETSLGGVDDVIVIHGGSGYRVGDKVYVNDPESIGTGFSAEVENIDGYGAILRPTMEIDSVIIKDGGYSYDVGDSFLITSENIVLEVTSVASEATPTLRNFDIFSVGKNYKTTNFVFLEASDVTYNSTTNKLSLVDNTVVPITGLVVVPYTPISSKTQDFAIYSAINSLKYVDSITDVELVTSPTPHIKLLDAFLVFNGVGATATANLTLDVISSVTVDLNGLNYVDPQILVVDSTGSGAKLTANRDGTINAQGKLVGSEGKIISITVISGGSGYTSPTIQIYDAAGDGFIAKAICDDSTSGAITGVSLSSNGNFIELPPSSENIPYDTTISLNGHGAKFDILYKIKRLDVVNNGIGYRVENSPAVLCTSGIGFGLSLLPVLGAGGSLDGVIIQNGGNDYATSSIITFATGGGITQASGLISVRNGVVVGVNITSAGSGYTYNYETGVTNFGFTVDPIGGSSAQANVDAEIILDGTGSIIGVEILSNGIGYSSATLVIDGSYTVQADITVQVNTGVDLVSVTHLGVAGAWNISTLDPWKKVLDDSGDVQNLLYKESPISGDTGSGGVLSYYVDINGKLAVDKTGKPMVWISNQGTGYTNPTVIIGDNVGKIPTISLGVTRGIKSITIIDGGSGYNTKSTSHIIGDGTGARTSLVIDGEEGVSAVNILATANTNKGFVGMPTVTVEDTEVETLGKISKVKLLDGGRGFSKFPILKCEIYDTQETVINGDLITEIIPVDGRSSPAIGANLLSVSNSIGGIKKISQKSFGYGYRELPAVSAPVVMLVSSADGFRLGENVSHTGQNTRDISDEFVSVVGNGSAIALIYLNVAPISLGVYEGQKIVVTGVDSAVNHSFYVKNTNPVTKSIQVQSGVVIPDTTYLKGAGSASLVEKSGQIINIDSSRNLIWVDNVDNIFEYEQDIGYLTEDGDDIVSEFFSSIEVDKTIIGHKSGKTAHILWSNRASVTAVRSPFGATEKYFTSNQGMVSERNIRTTNSSNIQDYAFEVHTGLSFNHYEKLLKETVHPSGYHLSGIFDGVTEVLDQLKVELAAVRSSQGAAAGESVFITISALLASIWLMKKKDEDVEDLYFDRHYISPAMMEKSISLDDISAFDLWNYPERKVWKVGEEGDDNDYTMWLGIDHPMYTTIRNSSIEVDYTQVDFEITFTSADPHGLKIGDYILHVSEGDSHKGTTHIVETVTDVNTFTVMSHVSANDTGTGVRIIRTLDGGTTASYVKTGTIFAVTKNDHGLIGSENTWLYVQIPTGNSNQLQNMTQWLQVSNVTTNTFDLDGLSSEVISGHTTGTLRYWKAEDVKYKIMRHAAVRDVAYGIDGGDVTITGLDSSHDLFDGAWLYVRSDGNSKYIQVESNTDTTITFADDGFSGNMDIEFMKDHFIPPIRCFAKFYPTNDSINI